ELDAPGEVCEQRTQALHVALVDVSRRVVRAAGVEEEQPLGELDRVRPAQHARIDPDTGARIAGSYEMHVAIPDALRVDAFPRRLYQLVLRELGWQRQPAWVEEALLGPEMNAGAGRERRRPGCRHERAS